MASRSSTSISSVRPPPSTVAVPGAMGSLSTITVGGGFDGTGSDVMRMSASPGEASVDTSTAGSVTSLTDEASQQIADQRRRQADQHAHRGHGATKAGRPPWCHRQP